MINTRRVASSSSTAVASGNGKHTAERLTPREILELPANAPEARQHRERVVKLIKAWLKQHHPTWGVDRLLSNPFLAVTMAEAVMVELGRAVAGRHSLTSMMVEWAQGHPTAAEEIKAICRDAMNGRKSKQIKPSKSSPASRAAETRRKGRP